MSHSTLLLLALLLPLMLVPVLLLLRHRPNWREGASLITGVLLAGLIFRIVCLFQDGVSLEYVGFALIPELPFAFTVEPLGLIFASVASVLWPLTTLFSIGYMRAHNEQRQTQFYCFFAIALFSVIGIAFAANLLTLFIFYEILTLATLPLVTHTRTTKAKRSGRVYLGLLLSTSILFLLSAIITTWLTTGTTDFKPGGIFNNHASTTLLSGLLILFVLGVGKAALMPFHYWLPAAMVAPAPVSALLHAVAVVKAGVFTILKICVYTFGLDNINDLASAPFLLYLAGFSILCASVIAFKEQNLKARLAYSTVSQLGYVTMGALLASPIGVIGSAMHITMHAFSKITLFFCAGAIMVATQKTEVRQMHGLGKQMPLTMLAFAVASLGIIGLPPAGGTWSKWFLLMATVEKDQWVLMLVLMASSLLSIGYLLIIPLRAFFPKTSEYREQRGAAHAVDLAPTASLTALLLTAIGCLLLFFYADAIFQLASKVV